MDEKVLDEAVVWDDAETFDGTAWRGKVDIISAGFPCQPVSVAGKRKGHKDKRWQWPTVRRIVCEVRPSFVFLENVPGIKPYIPGITAFLTEIGYRWTYGFFSAAGCGASQIRKRWFLLAYFTNNGCSRTRLARTGRNGFENCGQNVVNSNVGVSNDNQFTQSQGSKSDIGGRVSDSGKSLLDIFPPGRNEFGKWRLVLAQDPSLEPEVCRVAVRTPNRVDRLRALGNAVVPVVAAKAWRILLARLFETGMIDV
ncbi:hypothetical protein ES703_95841 [subsurface metagenome]